MKSLLSLTCIVAALTFIVCVAATVPAHATEKRNLGLVGIRSGNGTWLQTSIDGQIRVNPTRDNQETWFLIAVDRTNHVYAFASYRSGKFLAKQVGSRRCVSASSSILSSAAEWKLVRGKPRVDAIALRNVADGTLLNHRSDQGCVDTTSKQIEFNRGWGGWWDLRIVGKPTGDPGTNSILGEPVNVAPVPIPVITSL